MKRNSQLFQLLFFQRYKLSKINYTLLAVFLLLLTSGSAKAQTSLAHNDDDLIHQSEIFWASIDFFSVKKELGQTLQLSQKELDLFYQFIQPDSRR